MSMFRRQPTQLSAPVDGYDLVLTDLDGVVYRGGQGIPGAIDALNAAAEKATVAYITNNASRTDEAVAQQLRSLGLHAQARDVITSPQAAIGVLRQKVEPGSLVLVVGGEGITSELEKAGYRYTRSADDNPDAVIQGFSPDLAWKDLAEACFALQEFPGREPIPWVATNTDWTFPQERGLAPGNGTMVSAVHTAVQRLPEFAGKPETPIYTEAFDRFGSTRAVMIGDRLDTDIQGANASGIDAILVLTGVDRPKQLLAAAKNMRPKYIVPTLSELFEPYPETTVKRDGSHQVGDARVKMDGHIVKVVREGSDPLNLLRAACSAIWASGLAIYGLQVPDILLEDLWR
jgi:glycerol 3-phosphatase-2